MKAINYIFEKYRSIKEDKKIHKHKDVDQRIDWGNLESYQFKPDSMKEFAHKAEKVLPPPIPKDIIKKKALKTISKLEAQAKIKKKAAKASKMTDIHITEQKKVEVTEVISKSNKKDRYYFMKQRLLKKNNELYSELKLLHHIWKLNLDKSTKYKALYEKDDQMKKIDLNIDRNIDFIGKKQF